MVYSFILSDLCSFVNVGLTPNSIQTAIAKNSHWPNVKTMHALGARPFQPNQRRRCPGSPEVRTPRPQPLPRRPTRLVQIQGQGGRGRQLEKEWEREEVERRKSFGP